MPAPFRPIRASRSRGGSANETPEKTTFAPKLCVRPDACRVATPVACRSGARVDHHSSLRGRGSGALAHDLRPLVRGDEGVRRRARSGDVGDDPPHRGRGYPAADRIPVVARAQTPLASARAARRGGNGRADARDLDRHRRGHGIARRADPRTRADLHRTLRRAAHERPAGRATIGGLTLGLAGVVVVSGVVTVGISGTPLVAVLRARSSRPSASRSTRCGCPR